MTTEVIKTRTTSVSFADGIRYDEVHLEGAMLTLQDAEETLRAYYKVSNGKHCLTLVDWSHVKSMTREARDHFASRTCSVVVTAMAIVVTTPMSDVAANLFVKLSKPGFPHKIFSNKEEALLWLKEQNSV